MALSSNGIKLGFSKTGTSTYTDLPGLLSVPEIGGDAEKIDVTSLTDKTKKYIKGIGDSGELEYKFNWDNLTANSLNRTLRDLEAFGKPVNFKQTFTDGTAVAFAGEVSVKHGGGEVNGRLEMTMTITLTSEFTWTDPAGA